MMFLEFEGFVNLEIIIRGREYLIECVCCVECVPSFQIKIVALWPTHRCIQKLSCVNSKRFLSLRLTFVVSIDSPPV